MNSDKLEILKCVMLNPDNFITRSQVIHIAVKNNLDVNNPEHNFLITAKTLRRTVNEIYAEIVK